jgi:hypothetical protein
VERMAPACLYLAAKVEEQPQPIQNILEIFQYMSCARMLKPHLSLGELPESIVGEKRADLTKMESLLLTQLGFIIHTELPYKFLCAYLDFLGLGTNRDLAQRAWNYSNDIFRSDACVRHDAPTLACSCIHLAAADMSLPLPFDPPWWGVFNVSDVGIACVTMILQQLLDMPKAFNVLEPPPSITAKENSDISENHQLGRSSTTHLTFNSAEGSSGGVSHHSDEVIEGGGIADRKACKEDVKRADKCESPKGDCAEDRRRSSDNRRGGSHREDRCSGSDQRRSYARDDTRRFDQDYRKDFDRDDTRADYRRDRSRERQRSDYRGHGDERHVDRWGDRRDSTHSERDARRDDYCGDRMAASRELGISEHQVRRDRGHASSSDKASQDTGENVPKAGRRSGRWDES